jgi:hypothetical protein
MAGVIAAKRLAFQLRGLHGRIAVAGGLNTARTAEPVGPANPGESKPSRTL